MNVIGLHKHAGTNDALLNWEDVAKTAAADIIELLDAIFFNDFTNALLPLRRLRRYGEGLMVG